MHEIFLPLFLLNFKWANEIGTTYLLFCSYGMLLGQQLTVTAATEKACILHANESVI